MEYKKTTADLSEPHQELRVPQVHKLIQQLKINIVIWGLLALILLNKHFF